MCGITICFCDNSFKMLHIIYGKIKHDETVRKSLMKVKLTSKPSGFKTVENLNYIISNYMK